MTQPKGLTMTDFAQRRRIMVDSQVRPSDVTKFPVIQAMLSVPRENFVPSDHKDAAYMGDHIALAQDRVVLEPRSFAKMIDALDLKRDDLVLDIGCGLGYSSAVIAHTAEAVIAIEPDHDMAQEAIEILIQNSSDNVAVIHQELDADPSAYGPYDAIIFEGAVEAIPEAITNSLKPGGRIIAIFMEKQLGIVRIGRRTATNLVWRDVFNATAPILPGFHQKKSFAL